MDAVILRALEKRPERRFQSVAELLSAFRRAVTQAADVPADIPSHAIGVYFEIVHGDEEIDDEMFEDISIVLEIVEQELCNAAFLIPVRSSTSLLGIRLLPDEGAAAYERDDAASLVSEIKAQIDGRAEPHPAIHVQVSLSVGEVLCRPADQAQEIVGGPLLKVRSWPKETLLAPSA
jgi:eukaryotic-like serine/threonine-protein kinase